MANVTKVLKQVDDRFPVGTVVGLYPRRAHPDRDKPPSGAATASATVAADRSLTFTSVPDDGAGYVAFAVVGGRPVSVQTGTGKLSWPANHQGAR